ncbi:hypothetical protein [uncultured Methanobrevibacter sp.]|uniref:hypothetical protein n=1 Tax=uncultured Methanobrevibacter sp. TaxID=253161 RepID=UPI0025D1E65A|nr:hypothetical protein [uncultured Methanobrevibacter sp.]
MTLNLRIDSQKGNRQEAIKMMENMIMNVIRIAIILFIVYAVFKGLKTLLKIGIIIFIISLILGFLGF